MKMHDAIFEAEAPSVFHSLDFVILTDYLIILKTFKNFCQESEGLVITSIFKILPVSKMASSSSAPSRSSSEPSGFSASPASALAISSVSSSLSSTLESLSKSSSPRGPSVYKRSSLYNNRSASNLRKVKLSLIDSLVISILSFYILRWAVAVVKLTRLLLMVVLLLLVWRILLARGLKHTRWVLLVIWKMAYRLWLMSIVRKRFVDNLSRVQWHRPSVCVDHILLYHRLSLVVWADINWRCRVNHAACSRLTILLHLKTN